ncbi:MAG: ACT domain-containing protein [Bacillota bacterium]
MYIEQISVFVENKPGSAGAVTRVLGENGINIRAMSIADTSKYGILHMIVDDPQKGFDVLKKAHFTLNSADVLAVRLDDTPGALSRVLELLGDGGYNVEYAYAFITRKREDAIVILRVNDVGSGSVKLLLDAGVELVGPEQIRAL